MKWKICMISVCCLTVLLMLSGACGGKSGTAAGEKRYTRSAKYRLSEPSSITLRYRDGDEEQVLELTGEDLQRVSDAILMDWNTETQDEICQYMMLFEPEIKFTAELHYDAPIDLKMLGGGDDIEDIFISLDEGYDEFTIRKRDNTAYVSHISKETRKLCEELMGIR